LGSDPEPGKAGEDDLKPLLHTVLRGELSQRYLVLEARCETIIRCEALGEADAAGIVGIDEPASNTVDLKHGIAPEIRGERY
jgi:hypothetical protein